MTKIPEGERNYSSEPENPYEIFGSIGGEMAEEFDSHPGTPRYFIWERHPDGSIRSELAQAEDDSQPKN